MNALARGSSASPRAGRASRLVTLADTAASRAGRALVLITLAGLAAFLLALAAVALGGRLAPLDGGTASLARDLARGVPSAAVPVVTDLGAFPTVAGVVLGAAVALVLRGRPGAAASLVLGLLCVFVTVRLVKDGVGRPRPPGHDALLTTPSFPSGHAAYATAWAAVALTLARVRVGPRSGTPTPPPARARAAAWARRTAVAAALLLTLAIGATRLLLDAHYLSDVVGGWGLGASLFALVGLLALAIGPMRHTEEGDDERSPRGRMETTA